MKSTKLLLFLVFILCITVSCNAKDSNAYLLIGMEDSEKDITKYKYDSLGRLSSMESNLLKSYISYNEKDKPEKTVMKITIQAVSMTDSSVKEYENVITSNYTYIGTDTIIIEKREVEIPLFESDISLSAIRPTPIYYTCILNNKGLVSKITREDNEETISFEYDKNDNLIKLTILVDPSTKAEKSYQSETTYEYDNKKNPYPYLPDYAAFNLGLQQICGRNNIHKIKRKDLLIKSEDITIFSYKYNEEGYPTEMKIENGDYWQKFNYLKQ